MASHSHPTPLLDDEDLDDDESQAEDDDANSASTSSSLPTAPPVRPRTTTTSSSHFVTVALPPAPNGIDRLPSGTVIVATPERQIIALPAPVDKKPALDDSRKLFQRLWTDEDEIELLRGFLDYTSQRRGGLNQDTAVFYDQIKCKLQLDFNKNQLIEKLRRLKKKYRTVVSKMSSGKDVCFKSAHDRTTFEISSKIWSHITPRGANDDNMDEDEDNNTNHAVNHLFSSPKTPKPDINRNPNPNLDHRAEDASLHSSRKRHRLSSQPTNAENNANPGSNVAGLIEDAVRNCISPLLKELLSSSSGVGGGIKGSGSAAYNPLPFGPFGSGGSSILDFGLGIGGDTMDERWKKQQILELEVYSKRIELMQNQIGAKLEELRSIRR